MTSVRATMTSLIAAGSLISASSAFAAGDKKPTPPDTKVVKTEPKAQPAPAPTATVPLADETPSRRSLAGLFSSFETKSRWDGYLGVAARSMTILDKSTIQPSIRIGTAWNGRGLLGVAGEWLYSKVEYAPDQAVTMNDYGVYAGWTVDPSWYVNASLIVAYKKGTIKIAAAEAGGDPELGTFRVLEPALLLEVNVTETFRVGFEYASRTITGSMPADVAVADLAPSTMALNFTFLGQ